MPAEERREARLAALEERARGKREEPGEQQKDHQEHVRDRRREVRFELAPADDPDRSHVSAVSGSVRLRKTSSSSPRSLYIPCTFQPSRLTRSITAAASSGPRAASLG